jgi:hypothetical protein
MSDTPETDAEVILCHKIPDGFNPPERSYVSSKFAEKLERERDEAREIAGRLAHFLERPAYSVDEAIARMEALNSYKKQKSQ